MNYTSTSDTLLDAESIYEQTVWQILLDGKAIERLASFQLKQAVGAHHQFELVVYHSQLQEAGSYRIEESRHLLGKTLTAMLGSATQPDRVSFSGLITGVAFRESQGLNGEIILSGYSPTILLESGPHLHSFYNQNLTAIAKEITQHLSGKLELALQPRYNQQIAYVAQHQESHFRFLTRMAGWYGEWLYYDGKKLCLGKPSALPRYRLSYGRHLEDLRMDTQLVATNFQQLSYQSSQDQLLTQTPPQNIAGLTFYGDRALEQSEYVYPQPVQHKPVQHVSHMGELMHMSEVNKAALAADTFYLRGVCKVPYLTPGCKVRIFVGESELGEYLVTEVEHELQSGNHYQSRFKAVGGQLNVLPLPAVAAPQASAQVAIVRRNDDPRGEGRVRVQFHWQQEDNFTDWIRVVRPDAGSSGEVAKNRGWMFVPEVGDQVMVDFEEGNPSAPFVLGSLFHGANTKTQGGRDNHLKTLQTRSGHTLAFDDSKENWSLTIRDVRGNCIQLDTQGQHLTLSAVERITLQAKNIDLQASQSVSITAGENVHTSAGEDLVEVAGKDYQLAAENIQITARDKISQLAKEIEAVAEQISLESTQQDLLLASAKKVDMQSSDKVSLF